MTTSFERLRERAANILAERHVDVSSVRGVIGIEVLDDAGLVKDLSTESACVVAKAWGLGHAVDDLSRDLGPNGRWVLARFESETVYFELHFRRTGGVLN